MESNEGKEYTGDVNIIQSYQPVDIVSGTVMSSQWTLLPISYNTTPSFAEP